jgi:hypothetical protein
MDDGQQRGLEFILQGGPARPVADEARMRRFAARRRGERRIDRRRIGEGRVRGKHHGKPRALHGGTEGRQLHGGIVRVRPHEPGREGGEDLFRRVRRHTHVSRQARGTPGERLVAKRPDQRSDLRLGQFALIHLAADGQGHRQHGIAERILLRPRPGPLGHSEQVVTDREIVLRCIRHG